jgi:AFG3 family protein
MHKRNFIYLFCIAVLFFISRNPLQISEKSFFNDYISNVTQIDFYRNSSVYFYINNETQSKYFINFQDKNNFMSNLKKHNYQKEILYKEESVLIKKLIDSFFFFGFLFLILISRNLMGMGFSSYIKSNDKVKIKLKDVAGLEYQKKEIFEFIDFLKNRNKYLKIGARMPRGALLHGPPGTGKTLLAKAVAGECGISFISVSGSDFSQMYVGVGASRIRSLFKEARSKAPCIIFIDEIDALARSRVNCSGGGGQTERDNTLNRLLVELDGFEDNDNILLFGATNRLDILDSALLRPGRFDRKIQFELPEKDDRVKIFEYYLEKMKINQKKKITYSKELGKISAGFSCADIANICNEASILTVRKNQKLIGLKNLKDAIDNVILGPEKHTFRLKEKERKIVAFHESGHAFLSYFLKNTESPIKVSIMPRGASALGFSQSESKDTKLHSREELKDKMCVLLGGRIAEELFCDDITTGASDDIERLTKMVYKFVTVFGMDTTVGPIHCDWRDKKISKDLRHKIDTAVMEHIDMAYTKARTILSDNKHQIIKLANLLLENETVIKKDFDDLWS